MNRPRASEGNRNRPLRYDRRDNEMRYLHDIFPATALDDIDRRQARENLISSYQGTTVSQNYRLWRNRKPRKLQIALWRQPSNSADCDRNTVSVEGTLVSGGHMVLKLCKVSDRESGPVSICHAVH